MKIALNLKKKVLKKYFKLMEDNEIASGVSFCMKYLNLDCLKFLLYKSD